MNVGVLREAGVGGGGALENQFQIVGDGELELFGAGGDGGDEAVACADDRAGAIGMAKKLAGLGTEGVKILRENSHGQGIRCPTGFGERLAHAVVEGVIAGPAAACGEECDALVTARAEIFRKQIAGSVVIDIDAGEFPLIGIERAKNHDQTHAVPGEIAVDFAGSNWCRNRGPAEMPGGLSRRRPVPDCAHIQPRSCAG